MNDPNTMMMLYKVVDGSVQDQNYGASQSPTFLMGHPSTYHKIGLALARIVGLPRDVLEKATLVSKMLSRRLERRKRKSKALHLSRRRNLVLKLKETLIQARDGNMDESALRSWLAKVQDEFVTRMTKLSEDIVADEDDEDEEEDGDQHNKDQQDADNDITSGIAGDLGLDGGADLEC